jgi:hypothetical protein
VRGDDDKLDIYNGSRQGEASDPGRTLTATTARPIVLVVALLLLVAPPAADAQPAGKM